MNYHPKLRPSSQCPPFENQQLASQDTGGGIFLSTETAASDADEPSRRLGRLLEFASLTQRDLAQFHLLCKRRMLRCSCVLWDDRSLIICR
jgi:hypothetical protein